MSIKPGTRIGSYEVTSPLGEGGMGVVFRAHDTKLQRDVALKLLPDHFANDAERLARFQREAQVLASLNHPNIAQIYGLEDSTAQRCIVMELVEGATLQERLKRGPIPIDEALPMAKQIAEALEAAHERGIIHRDLKPANIKLTSDGKIKVLDFGLAKAFQEQQAAALSNSPTLIGASVPGVVLGTAAYMSPEQAKGKETDRTTDVWAFGCVLYEMFTGHAVFDGDTVGEILGGVFKAEPDWHLLPTETPEGIRRLLRRCLRKERKQRLQYIGDARIEIDEAQIEAPVDGHVWQSAVWRSKQFAWTALMIVTIIAVVLGIRAFRPLPAAPEMRLEINSPPTADPVSMAISPDGQKIVFVATSEGVFRLWLRSLDSVSVRPLMGTDSASYPFWSPDSRSVGFFADGKLKRIDIDGGSVQTLTTAFQDPRGGAWNRDGIILFAPTSNTGPLFRIRASGGEPRAETQLKAPQRSHRFPQFLPDGRHFLYYVQGTPDVRGVYVGQLDGLETHRLFDADSAAVYASSGHLLFVRQETLFAQSFDSSRLELAGNPFPVAERVTLGAGAQGSAALSASIAGPIVYRAASATGLRQLIWFDRAGKEIGKAFDPIPGFSPQLSPDGRHLALTQQVNQNYDVWLLDLGRRVLSRFTSDPALDTYSVWSQDGSRIAFSSNRKGGANDLYQKATTGAGTEELLLATAQDKYPTDWSRDGHFLLYRSLDPKKGYDIWALPLDGGKKPFPVVRTNADARDGQFSPDGKWIAFQSDESGRFEVYVQPFPGPGGKIQISTNGGAQVRWRRDGKELFYIALDNQLMAVPLQFSSGQTLDAGAPVSLFLTHVGGAIEPTWGQQYMVSPDGQRFLMNNFREEAASPITVILDWKPKP